MPRFDPVSMRRVLERHQVDYILIGGLAATLHVYELQLVRSPVESKGEFTVYTWDIEWVETVDGETIRHVDEPDVGWWDSVKLFFSGLLPSPRSDACFSTVGPLTENPPVDRKIKGANG